MSNGEGRECGLRYHWRVRQGLDHIGHVTTVRVFTFFSKSNRKLLKGFR